MKYFSKETIVNSFQSIKDCLENKMLGLLAILKVIDCDVVEDNRTYCFIDGDLSKLLDDMCYLEGYAGQYGNSPMYVKFSKQWKAYVKESFIGKQVSIYSLIPFLYKFEGFSTELTNEQLLSRFCIDYHISRDTVLYWFSQEERDLTFSDNLLDKKAYRQSLKITNDTLSLSAPYSVAARAGELSRAPFIQTLYAGMDSIKCLLILKDDIDALYDDSAPSISHNGGLNNKATSLQRIYYGAPGTGKSHSVNELTKGESVIRTTFHPDSDYSTFVGCYKPATRTEVRYDFYKGKAIPVTYEDGKDFTEEHIVYEFVEQAFLQAYIQAWKFYGDDNKDGKWVKKQFLIIEEINRGNCAQIFGDLFQLLDRNKYGFSEYYIHADNDMRAHLAKAFQQLKESGIPQKDYINAICNDGLEEERKEDFVEKVLSGEILLLPNNLYIWATMNTSDQSLFPIDSAFKRRWDWMYVPIANASKGWKIEAGKGVYYDWWDFLEKINRHIYATTNSADKQLGYFFCKADDRNIISAETFVNKVIFYLWSDVFKDFGFGDDIFADNDDKDDSRLTFGKFYSGSKDGSASVVAGKVAVFMDNLEVEKFIETVDEDVDDENDFLDEEDSTDEVSSQKDRSKYSVNGKGSYNKGELVRKVVELYIDKHPGITVDELLEDFKDVKVASVEKNFLNRREYEGWLNSHTEDKRKETRYQLVSKNGVEIYVTTQIRLELMTDFIKQVGVWGFTIEKVD